MATGNVQFKVETGLLVNGNSNVAGDFQVSGNLIVGGTTVSSGNATGDIKPTPGNTYNLGNTTLRWAGLYTQNVDASGTISIAGATLANATILQTTAAVLTTANNTALGNNAGRWDFFANNANLLSIGVTGLANLATITVSSTLGVTGLSTLATANITGQADMRAAANVAGAMGVIGATSLSNTLAVSGAVTVTSNTTLKANSTVTSWQLLGNNTTANVTVSVNAYSVTGNATFANTVSVSGAANALSTLGVSGATTLANASLGAGVVTVNASQLSVINGIISVNTGSKLSVFASGNSTYGNLVLTNDVTAVEGNVSFRSGALFVDAVNNRVGIKNTAPDTDLKITGAANISGAVVIGGALLVQGLFTNSLAVDHNATTNWVANKHIDHTLVSVSPGSGLAGGGDISATRTLNVNPNNGISANASGVFAVGANGIVVTSAGININANTGVIANTSGIFATAASPGGPITAVQFNDNATFGGNGSFVYDKSTNTLSLSNSANIAVSATVGNATVNVVITSTQIKLMNATSNTTFSVPTAAQFGNGNFFPNANGSWTVPPGNNGLISNGTGIYVNSNSGIVANSTGTFVDPLYVARTFTLPDTGGSSTWYKLGTFNGAQSGQTIYFEIIGHTGYTASLDQDSVTTVFFKTSNGTSVDGNGFAGDSYYYNLGRASGTVTAVKWKANAGGVAATAFDLYVQLGTNISGSFYTVYSPVALWTNSIVTGQADPGAANSSILAATKEFKTENNVIWHAGNQGSGSGLNADLLDNIDSTGFAFSNLIITAGSGLTGGGNLTTGRTVSVNPNNGISANATGTFAVVANGIVLTATGINVNPNNGISANATGTWAVVANGLVLTATGINVNPNNGITANATGVFATGANGISITATGINVNPNTGITANATGVFATVYGRQALYLPSGALTPRATTGANTAATSNGAANQPDVDYLPFNGTAASFAKFSIMMPKAWDLSTITAKFAWRRASGTGAANVIWGIRAVAIANNATPVVGFGSNATVTSAASTTLANMVVSAETGACTVAGSPTAENMVFFEVFRDGVNASDTLDSVDAWLTGVTLYFTTNAINDA